MGERMEVNALQVSIMTGTATDEERAAFGEIEPSYRDTLEYQGARFRVACRILGRAVLSAAGVNGWK